MPELYADPEAMNPLLPSQQDLELSEKSAEILRQAGILFGRLAPITGEVIAEVLRLTNCYYSNLIEGHATNPADIAKAMERDFSQDLKKRNLQLEAKAHLEVQKKMEQKLGNEPDLNVFSKEFLCWVHLEFYKKLPTEFRHVRNPETGKEYIVIPGEIRKDEVTVGHHHAPRADSLDTFLARFSAGYSSARISASRRIVAIAASHHRLAWIHPFLDGNGRVIRLFTHALTIKNRISGHGLWTISRGLARTKDRYYELLNLADRVRENDFDGRGNLSERYLYEFCSYFLDQMIDQMKFMHGLIRPGRLESQMEFYVRSRNLFGKNNGPAVRLLKEAVTQGEFARGKASEITGKAESTARLILSQLLADGLLASESEKGKVRLALPPKILDTYFPGLFPQTPVTSN
jgi:Fic family protein